MQATDWPAAPGDMLTAAVEGLLHADRGAEQFAPFLLGLETRARRQLYTAGWLVRCWERGVSPEPLLTLLVLAFEGGLPALAEILRRARTRPASFTVGVVRLLESARHEEALAEAYRTIRRLAWRRVPPEMRDPTLRPQVYAELDAAIWEVMRERFGGTDPIETLLLGLDGQLEQIPGVVGNRLRVARLRPPADIEVEIEAAPETHSAPQEEALLLRELEAQAGPLAWASLTTPQTDEEIAAAHGVSPKTVQRDRMRLRAYLARLSSLR